MKKGVTFIPILTIIAIGLFIFFVLPEIEIPLLGKISSPFDSLINWEITGNIINFIFLLIYLFLFTIFIYNRICENETQYSCNK